MAGLASQRPLRPPALRLGPNGLADSFPGRLEARSRPFYRVRKLDTDLLMMEKRPPQVAHLHAGGAVMGCFVALEAAVALLYGREPAASVAAIGSRG